MGVSPMKELRKKSLEIPGPADKNICYSRAGRPCHLRVISFRAIPAFKGRVLPASPPSNDNSTIRRTSRSA